MKAMGDRQDIDALLVGALYGELDGDDRARLDAHLASHPGDRAALDGLRSTRALLRDSGVSVGFGDAEPPSAISARLLQAAARRAPAPRLGDGILGFFTGLFRPLAMHPALSAAAALVLVVGIGGVMMRRGQWKAAQPPAASQVAGQEEALRARMAEPAAIAGAGAGSASTNFQVGLADGDLGGGPVAPAALTDTEGVVGKDDAAGREPNRQQAAATEAGKLAARADRAGDATVIKPAKPTTDGAFLEVDKRAAGADIALQESDEPNESSAARGLAGAGRPADESSGDQVDATRAPSRGQGAGRGSSVVTGTKVAASAPAAPPSIAPSPAPVDPGAATNALKKEAQNMAWARDRHALMVKMVNAGKCTEAGQIGAEIARKAPEYYQSAVANDRAVRSCQAYVDRARRAKAPAPAKSKVGNQQPDSRDELEQAK